MRTHNQFISHPPTNNSTCIPQCIHIIYLSPAHQPTTAHTPTHTHNLSPAHQPTTAHTPIHTHNLFISRPPTNNSTCMAHHSHLYTLPYPSEQTPLQTQYNYPWPHANAPPAHPTHSLFIAFDQHVSCFWTGDILLNYLRPLTPTLRTSPARKPSLPSRVSSVNKAMISSPSSSKISTTSPTPISNSNQLSITMLPAL